MKNLFPIIILLFCASVLPVSAQVSFTKGEVIKKSYASETMVVPPVLGKSENGFVILSSALMSTKKIVQLNLDTQMNPVGEEVVVKLPKGKKVSQILNIDGKMIAVLWSGDKKDPFECYHFDTEKSDLGELLMTIPIDEYPGREDLEISILNEDFHDFIGFIVRPRIEYANVFRKVVVTNRELNKTVWSQVITDPFVPESKQMGDFRLIDIYFNDAYTLVTRFSRPFLKEEKDEVQTNMYHFDGKKMENVWNDQVIRSTVNEELLSLPLPFISKNDKVEVYKLSCDIQRGSFELVKFDIRGDEMDRFPLTSEIDNLENVRRVGIYGYIIPVNNEFENGSFCFLISERLKQVEMTYQNMRTSMKHYIVSFKLDEQGVQEDHVIDAGYIAGIWGDVDDKIILSNSLDAVVNGQIVHAEQNEVFDRFVQVTKRVQPGRTYHYLLDGDLYSFHSEYATGNMTSQLVKWNFE